MAAARVRGLPQPRAAASLKIAGTSRTFSRLSTEPGSSAKAEARLLSSGYGRGGPFWAAPSISSIMRMSQIVLAEQVFPIVVAVRCADNRMNVLPVGLIAVLSELCQV